MTNNQIAYWTLQENQRSHLANEENDRIKAKASSDTAKANLMNAGTKQSELQETIRHNKRNEGIGIANAVTGGIGSILGGMGSVTKGVSSLGKLITQ